MADLISRSALFKTWDTLDETQDPNLLIDEMIKATQDATTVDAVVVMRCKDCIHCGRSPFGYSPTMGWCKLHGHHRRFDYYCASAEVEV